MTDVVGRAAVFAQVELNLAAEAGLSRFETWLRDEAIPAGALGPSESDRIATRHIADSLAMAYGWATEDPGTVADLGSGAGLPGLPLAIALPSWSFLLVERSAKRCGLLNRALRVLDLRNVRVMEADFRRRHQVVDVVVARAVASPEELQPVVEGWLGPSGTAVLAVSAVTEAPSGWSVVDIPEDILDRRARLLMMRRQ